MTDMTTSSFNNCSHIANDSALRLPDDGKFACQRSEKKCFSNISVMELPNPVYQGKIGWFEAVNDISLEMS